MNALRAVVGKRSEVSYATSAKHRQALTAYKKKAPERVLDEDSYAQTYAHIIRRDFFPDAEVITAKNKHFESLCSLTILS